MSKKAELVGSYFGSIYLTVISLLQGIVLSQLIPNIITYTKIAENPWTDVHLLPLVLMLLIIFIVWHHYAIGIFFLRWFPNIIDTIIPFVISIGQFFLLSYLTITDSVTDIDLTSWSRGFAAILILGSFAYFSAAQRIDASLFTNIMSLENAECHIQKSRKYYTMAGYSVLFQGLYALLMVLVGREIWLLGSLLFMVSHILLSEYFLLRDVRSCFVKGIDEFDSSRK